MKPLPARSTPTKKNNYHVLPAMTGDSWNVVRSGASKASRSFDSRVDAIDFGHEITRKHHSKLFIHYEDGTVQQRHSYVSEPEASYDEP